MEIVLEVSEKEDYSEFPITNNQTVEITSKKKQEPLHREETSLASGQKTEDKSTQTVSRRVWRKIKKKELLRQQNGIETTSQASSNSRSCSNAEIFGRTARISERSRTGIQRTRRKIAETRERAR